MPIVVVLLVAVLGLALTGAPASPSESVLRSIRIYSKPINYKVEGDCDVTRLDFRNFAYEVRDPRRTVRLRKGEYHQAPGLGGFDDWSLEQRAILSAAEPAAIAYLYHSYGGGSSNQDLVVMVFSCLGNNLVNTQMIVGDGHALSAGVWLRGERMLMRSADFGGGAHCCPEWQETALFEWDGKRLALKRVWRKLINPIRS